MTHAFPSCLYARRRRLVTDELTSLVDAVLAGDLVADRATAQRLVTTLGAAQDLAERHLIDNRGRCAICWRSARRWWQPRRRNRTCTVYETFGESLDQMSSVEG